MGYKSKEGTPLDVAETLKRTDIARTLLRTIYDEMSGLFENKTWYKNYTGNEFKSEFVEEWLKGCVSLRLSLEDWKLEDISGLYATTGTSKAYSRMVKAIQDFQERVGLLDFSASIGENKLSAASVDWRKHATRSLKALEDARAALSNFQNFIGSSEE